MPRLTYKYMMKWLQSEFDRLEIDWEPFDMYYTRFRPQDYEGGAAVYIIRIRDKQAPANETSVLVFDFFKNIQPYLDSGKWKLRWLPANRFSLSDSYITIEKL